MEDLSWNLELLVFSPNCLFVIFTVVSYRVTRLDHFTVEIHDSIKKLLRNQWTVATSWKWRKYHVWRTFCYLITCTLCSTGIIQQGNKFKSVTSTINELQFKSAFRPLYRCDQLIITGTFFTTILWCSCRCRWIFSFFNLVKWQIVRFSFQCYSNPSKSSRKHGSFDNRFFAQSVGTF